MSLTPAQALHREWAAKHAAAQATADAERTQRLILLRNAQRAQDAAAIAASPARRIGTTPNLPGGISPDGPVARHRDRQAEWDRLERERADAIARPGGYAETYGSASYSPTA